MGRAIYNDVSVSNEHCVLYRRIIDLLLEGEAVPISKWFAEELSSLVAKYDQCVTLNPNPYCSMNRQPLIQGCDFTLGRYAQWIRFNPL